MKLKIITKQGMELDIDIPDSPLSDKQLEESIKQITDVIKETILLQRSINGEVYLFT